MNYTMMHRSTNIKERERERIKHRLFTDIQNIYYVEILLVTRINKHCSEHTDHSKCLICECDIQEN